MVCDTCLTPKCCNNLGHCDRDCAPSLKQEEAVARVTLEATGDDAVVQSVTFTEHGADLPEGTLLYAAPPSTAEAQARALEEAGESMVEHFRDQRLDLTFALAVKEGLYQRAQRIREEGLCCNDT